MNNKRRMFSKKGFTLVELIVVIAILSILSVTAFMILNKWLGKSRDARRVADLTVVEQGLQMYSMEKNILPKPYNYTGVYTDSGTLLRYQGEFGEETRKTIGNIANKVEDPNGGDYKYSLSFDSKTYQVSAVYENTDISYIDNVYAQDGVSKIQGIYGEFIVVNIGTNYYLRHIPSLFASGTVITGNQYNYINQDKKQLDNSVFVKYTEITGLYTGADKTTILSGIVDAFSGEGITTNEIASMTISNAPGGTKVSADSSTSTTSTSGVCGSSNGQIFTTQPIDNLCTSGTTGSVTATSTGRTWTCGTTACSAIKNDWCNYTYTANAYHSDWVTDTELGYHDDKCYVFGDEDATAIAACNQRVTDNATLGGSWVWVPARWFVTDGNGTDLKNSYYQRAVTYNSHNYVCRGFAVMKYEAKFVSTASGKTVPNISRGTWAESDYATDNDTYADTIANGGITSKAADYPIASLRQGEAIQACGTEGTYHLITDNEWMAIARNIEQQPTNRTNSAVGNGGIYRGNVNLTDSMSWSSYSYLSSNKYTYPAGNDTDNRGTNAIGNRRLYLSNGTKVWDIAGNVWEHVNKSNNPSASNVRTTSGWDTNSFSTEAMCSNGTWNWRGWYGTDTDSIAACIFMGAYNKDKYGPSGNYNANNGVGRIYANNAETINNVFLRGGTGSNGAYAGVFSLRLSRDATNQFSVGFRCVK